jgi:hypothetical protein
VLGTAVVWLLMTVILVLLPDAIDEWVGLDIARVIAWAVACGLWVVTIEPQWRAHVGPFPRLVLQLLLWIAAALIALWIQDLVTM